MVMCDITRGKSTTYTIKGRKADSPIKKFDVQRGMLIATTAVGKMPRTIDLSNDGRYLFVANYGDNSITIVNTEAMSVIKTFSDQLRPCGLCFSKDRKELWVTNYYSNTVCIYKFAE